MYRRSNKIRHHAKRIVASLSPASIVKRRNHKQIIADFAEKLGFVYFGFVDQREDEHRLVRGLTLSPTHRDNHYCIGSYEGYDMVLVERQDIIMHPGKPDRSISWFIVEVDLHTRHDMPHVFLGTHSHSETFYAHLFARFNKLIKIGLGTFGAHSDDFVNNYSVYTEPAKTVETEQLFNHNITATIAKHFRPLDIELNHDNLYIYADNLHITTQLIDTMVKNGLWLAKQLDAQAEAIYNKQPLA